MVWHVVMLKPRADLSSGDRAHFAAVFERAMRAIPTVREVRIGRRFTHGAGYEAGMPDAADIVAVVAFDDRAGLQAYLRHPAHEELGELFGRLLESALVYDFEVGGLETIAKLL